jgi:hypothetical protein
MFQTRLLNLMVFGRNLMEKSIAVSLNRFSTTPHSLRIDPAIDAPTSTIRVNLANLYHHYYFDKHGRVPPNPDPSLFEHLQYLVAQDEFRITGDGLGVSTASRRTMSSELGHAFCRWFLHDHVDITYFAHIEQVMRRGLHPGFGGLTIQRSATGDAPDYFCAESVDKIYLAEAKGRHEPVSFQKKEFGDWRKQFDRVIVRDRTGTPRKMKGFIVATRFATETKPATKSGIYAEDPDSPGERFFDGEDAIDLGNTIVSLHYADIASKLNQPILAEALLLGFRTPAEIQFRGLTWELNFGPYGGRRYVGGYYPPSSGALRPREEDGKIVFMPSDPFRLDIGYGTFVGLEETVFKQLVVIARTGSDRAADVRKAEQIAPFYSAISLLRDGSVVGPLDFFNFVGPFLL